ncbi:DNA polymerase IV [Conexibacter sp. DBS9H8]|uniref:DNA polymerase IV n=1 Tax=Conexibacter sp. DBS9H8 TaxID=2937801 RepID=UPI00200FBE00|nr:DNA polymerase IV [Conexibacter sp. DBS9H8]
MLGERVIAHLDMDAFYVSVELQRRPELRGRPVIVAGTGPRSVVTTASYEARRFGVGSAMPSSRARRLCPDAVFLAPDFAHYRTVSAEVMAILRRHVETVEVIGLDEAYLDLSGLPAPKAGMRRILTEITARTGLGASVGIGPNKLIAKVASDAEKPRGFVVLTREQAAARFARAPCRLIPGIGAKTAERLAQIGLHTVGELAVASPQALAGSFSARSAGQLQALARFEHEAEVSPQRKVVSESRSRTFDADLSDPDDLRKALDELAARLCRDLAARGRSGRTIGISVRLSDFSNHSRARTLAVAVSAPEQILPVTRGLLDGFLLSHPGRTVRLLGVRVAGLQATEEADQLTLAV